MSIIVLNVLLVLILVSMWVGFILWKGVLKDILKQLEEAIDTHNKLLARTFSDN